MLAAGTWDLNITAEGYIGQQIDDVVVTEGQVVILNVALVPFVNPVDTTDTPGLIIYPDPAENSFTLVLPSRQFGKVNIMIFNSMGIKMADFIEDAVEDGPLRIDISDLEGGVYILQVRNRSSKETDRSRFVVVRR
jgi:hypothetical protein